MTRTYNDASLTYSQAAQGYDDIIPELYSHVARLYNDPGLTYNGTRLAPPPVVVDIALDVTSTGSSDRSGGAALGLLLSVPDPTGTKFEFPSGGAAPSVALGIAAVGGKSSASGDALPSLGLDISAVGAHATSADVTAAFALAVAGDGVADRLGVPSLGMTLTVTAVGQKPTAQGYVTISHAGPTVTLSDELA